MARLRAPKKKEIGNRTNKMQSKTADVALGDRLNVQVTAW